MCLVDEIGVEDDGSVGSVGDDHRTELESVPLLLSGGRDRAGRVARYDPRRPDRGHRAARLRGEGCLPAGRAAADRAAEADLWPRPRCGRQPSAARWGRTREQGGSGAGASQAAETTTRRAMMPADAFIRDFEACTLPESGF